MLDIVCFEEKEEEKKINLNAFKRRQVSYAIFKTEHMVNIFIFLFADSIETEKELFSLKLLKRISLMEVTSKSFATKLKTLRSEKKKNKNTRKLTIIVLAGKNAERCF